MIWHMNMLGMTDKQKITGFFHLIEIYNLFRHELHPRRDLIHTNEKNSTYVKMRELNGIIVGEFIILGDCMNLCFKFSSEFNLLLLEFFFSNVSFLE